VAKSQFSHQSSESGREDAKREAEAVMPELRLAGVRFCRCFGRKVAVAPRYVVWARRRIRPARGRWARRSGCLTRKAVGRRLIQGRVMAIKIWRRRAMIQR
jgi:hypothetical protein